MLRKFDHKALYTLWILGILYLLPILLINSPYYDDIGRSVYGYFSWGIDGRPLSDLAFALLNMGGPATNIAPFPQILGILILTSICYLLHLKLNPEHKMGWLIFTPIFLSPFFVQNLAFQFDSLTMALSVAFACIPILVVGKGWLKLFLCAFICVVIALCFYQAALSAFIAVICLYVIFELNKHTPPLKLFSDISAAAVGMTVGYVIYAKMIVPIFVTSDYANGYNQLIGGLDDLIANINLTETVLKSFLTGFVGKIYLVVFTFALMSVLLMTGRMLKQANGASVKCINILLMVLALFTLLVCIPGPGLALKNVPIGPRVFIGFGFFVTGVLAVSSFMVPNRAHLTNILSIILCIVSFSFIATFANATKSQDRLTEKVINEISAEIYKVGVDNVKTITVAGQMLYTPVADKAIIKFPLMRQLIPDYFNGPLAWGVVKMTEFHIGRPQPPVARQQELINGICTMKEIANGGLYKIFYKDGDMVVSFLFTKCN